LSHGLFELVDTPAQRFTVLRRGRDRVRRFRNQKRFNNLAWLR
jgi:hypothetical protein